MLYLKKTKDETIVHKSESGPLSAVPCDTSFVLDIITQMTEDQLKQIYGCVGALLKGAQMLSTDMDNINVVSVRFSLSTRDDIRRLAIVRRTTVSDVVRSAVDDYCEIHKAEL
jgi:hypothetical protein